MTRISNNDTRTTFAHAYKAYEASEEAQRAVKQITGSKRVTFVELDFDKEFTYIRVCIKCATSQEVREIQEKTRLGLVSEQWVSDTYIGEYFIAI